MSAVPGTFRGRALAVGGAGMLLCAAGWVMSPDQFFRSWLFGYLLWLGVALGCLAILMIQHVTGGAWGAVIRRILEAATRTLPAMAVLFLPLLAGLGSLYPWARPGEVAGSELLRHKAAYLNVGFFLARAAAYFIVWIALSAVLNARSRRQDETGDARLARRLQILSAAGLLLFVLTMTFASVDWLMSLEPEWFSTIFGPLLMAGQAVSGFCLAVVAAVALARAVPSAPLAAALTPGRLHDLGKLLFSFVLIWAYFALSQFLIIWSGNLPEEIPWYLRRLRGGWEWVGLSIILLHFGLPFLLLLSRPLKRDARRLVRVAALLFVMRAVDLYWMVAPAFPGDGWRPHWLDLAAPAAIGGVWLGLFAWELSRRPLLPERDPELAEVLGHAAV